MSRCTWKGCEAEGTVPQLDRDGERWASLCQSHHDELDSTIDRGLKGVPEAVPQLLRAWVLASGGNPLSRPLKGSR